MKYLFILFLLIASVKQKDNENKDLQDLIDDEYACNQAEYNIESCFPIKLTTKNAQCCLFEHTYYDGSKKSCEVFPTSIKEEKKNIDINKISATAKEVNGFRAYILSNPSSEEEIKKLIIEMASKMNYKCKDGEITFTYGNDTYTSSEVNILKSSNHCLRYFYSFILDEDYKSKVNENKTCFNADLMKSSKDEGIECGYLEFNFVTYDGNNDKYKTCYIYNENLLSNSRIDILTKSIFLDSARSIMMKEEKSYESYTVNFVNSKGKSYTYDPLSGKVVDNKTNMLNLSKYLGLLMIFLL